MTGTLIRRVLLAPAVILTAGACFATRNDVRVLQSEMQAMRAEADTARMTARQREVVERARLDSVLVSIIQQLGIVGDTVRSVHATTMRLRGDVREDLVAIRQQLITVEARVGASAQRIQELRAGLEADAAERAAAPVTPPTPADTSRKPPATGTPGAPPAGAAPAPAAAAQPPAPGPAQMYQMALDQLRGGRNGAARGAFGALLQQHPGSDLAPDALFGIGQAFENEGAGSSADSVYALVAQRYPASDRAPTALYKRATALRVTGRADDAKAIYRQIVDKYPRSDAAVLAAEFLGARKP